MLKRKEKLLQLYGQYNIIHTSFWEKDSRSELTHKESHLFSGKEMVSETWQHPERKVMRYVYQLTCST